MKNLIGDIIGGISIFIMLAVLLAFAGVSV